MFGPGWWVFIKCSANATLMDGRTSAGNGYPHTEQRCSLPSRIKRGSASCFFAMPQVYAVGSGVQPLWISNGTTTQLKIPLCSGVPYSLSSE